MLKREASCELEKELFKNVFDKIHDSKNAVDIMVNA